ncbi:RidA family protein [Burkholderia sp. Bp8963]|uniref:RidA family protein n=1 Tax=Burkholderia sp. Bp8963 TaxID=2184547 RepID=UPI000F5B14EB|nr:RidA family protein [Burkholderia sp. Bp8963]RQS71979.1 RidA family protein [Burkholderia sp. Bp8963]
MAFNPAELSLPAPFTPTGRYRAVVVQGGFAFVSGQLPRVDGELRYRGTVGVDLRIEEARDAARLCAANCLAVLDRELGGLHRLIRVVRVTGYVACHASFFDHADVIDAASDYLVGALGEAGAHSRTSIGVVSLPRHAPVELDLIAAIQP